jgi:hypothetical protein
MCISQPGRTRIEWPDGGIAALEATAQLSRERKAAVNLSMARMAQLP